MFLTLQCLFILYLMTLKQFSRKKGNYLKRLSVKKSKKAKNTMTFFKSLGCFFKNISKLEAFFKQLTSLLMC